jgi:hypothetical protein
MKVMFRTISRKSSHRVLGAEWLERRQPLAGDVGIALFGNQLVIEGDAQANAIVIERAAGGGVNIRGSAAGDAATTINGGTEAFHVASLDGNIMIDLGAGNDSLTLGAGGHTGGQGNLHGSNGNLRLEGNLLANLGAGNDEFSGNIAGRGDLTIMGGSGADEIAISGRVGSVTVIADGLSADASGADRVQLSNLRTSGDVSVFTQRGDDQIALSGDLRMQHSLTIDSGEGIDYLSFAASHFVVRGEMSVDPLLNNSSVSVGGVRSAATGHGQSASLMALHTLAPLTTDVGDPLVSATATGNALLSADPVGAGSAGLALAADASGGNNSLTSMSSLLADAALTPNGALVNGSLDAANSLNTGLLDDSALANLSAAANNSVATDTSVTGNLIADSSATHAALLQNAGTLAQAANPLAAAATDRVFNQFDESQLVGSSARNPTFLSNFSQDPSLNSVLNSLSRSQMFAPLS